MAVLENYSKNAGDHPFFAYAYLLSWETQEIRDKLQNFNRMSGIPVKCYFLPWGLLEPKELHCVSLTVAEKDKQLQESWHW